MMTHPFDPFHTLRISSPSLSRQPPALLSGREGAWCYHSGMTLSVCVLASGSSGNAICVQSGHTAILVDSGLAAGETERRLYGIGVSPRDLAGILISHAHIDHYRSAGTLHRRYDIPVFTEPATDRAIRQLVRNGSYRRIEQSHPLPNRIGGLRIRTFPTRHGGMTRPAGQPVGFVLSAQGTRIGVATDLGIVDEGVLGMFRPCNALILEANHDRDRVLRKLEDPLFWADTGYLEWVLSDEGHLSNQDCAEALVRLAAPQLRHLFLAHLSENHHNPLKDNNSFRAARDCVLRCLDEAAISAPTIHRTFRRGRTEGRPSEVITVSA
jgi:phosphoribosyl 1,2-cyclic phosphodiesterase